MATYEPRGDKSSHRTERRIAGPLPEYNRFDEYTGADYYRCRRCGAEALRRIDLEACCES
ncbi:hypothetical protein DQW50_16225 [Halorubrum sp. 48-1-W]|uniref:hypothetical protein n=1 Tax=Halorubrum sp. 48-1-W TaxID=2249761 RepID=UPI000DCD2526|nr:hypothetical protein [Halorubrum sp. 48-1-W]RAW44070.1 hypothetical protein DQW50_16225 [Halorubrum sp. 48-1-W]